MDVLSLHVALGKRVTRPDGLLWSSRVSSALETARGLRPSWETQGPTTRSVPSRENRSYGPEPYRRVPRSG